MYTRRTYEQLPNQKDPQEKPYMLIKRIRKIIFDRRAMSNAISATIMAGAVVALGLAVFTWAQGRASDYNQEFGETVDSETTRLQEKLVFEYIFYDYDNDNLTVYLLNCGTIDGIKIKTVYIYDDSNNLKGIFSNPTLYTFESLEEIQGQVLDRGDEGRLVLDPSESLGGFCNIKVVTERGATFDQGFVA